MSAQERPETAGPAVSTEPSIGPLSDPAGPAPTDDQYEALVEAAFDALDGVPGRFVTLWERAEHVVDAVLAAQTAVLPDQRGAPVRVDRGHIVCGELVFCNQGPVLHAWSNSGDLIEPERARSLGQALIEWAEARPVNGGSAPETIKAVDDSDPSPGSLS